MAEQIISSYGAKFGFVLDKASVKTLYAQVDTIKARIESKLNTTLRISKIVVAPEALSGAKNRISKSLNVGVVISKITITNDALASAKKRLQTGMAGAFTGAFTQASAGLIFPIDRFKVNAIELRKQVQAAFSSGTILHVNAISHVGSGVGSAAAQGNAISRFFGAGGTQGYGLMGGLSGALPGLAAVAGVNQLNTISEQLQSGKVSLGTITQGRGTETFNWLRAAGKEIGLDYRSQLPMFSNYLAGSINKQGYDASLQSFKDISLYGMTHGATTESSKSATRALGQMWSKGKVYAEELDVRLAA